MATDEEARATRDAKLEQLHERLTAAVDLLVSGEDWKRALEYTYKPVPICLLRPLVTPALAH